MKIKWYKSESGKKPENIDNLSSPTVVYLRKNIIEESREDLSGNEVNTYYTYNEAKINKSEYAEYLAERSKSDIDYLAMMLDVELEE